MTDSLKERLFRTDTKAWNNPWYGYIGAPVFAMVGVVIGQLYGVHLVSSPLGEYLTVALCLAVTMFVGFTGLAFVDKRT
ncbi:hypothetical protein CP556_16305 [Natrinema sp. CBA1119]|uniref:hypothetical protein n=1 Tax=Natrinema sp. CBA1119 TaxID=1608465 RepID=UPI000BF40010|nr:hypothetical protein [Natrinema sp. CBA1119]PGF17509.1 hypothetical protein CP556_16305 [Natrinema sp. CBA1119]